MSNTNTPSVSSSNSSNDQANVPASLPKKRRGFAAMSPEEVKAIARMGGKAAHAKGTAHRFSHEEAKKAGQKGGLAHGVNQAKRREQAEKSP